MKYHFSKGFKLKVSSSTQQWIYSTPATIDEAIADFDMILSDAFIADLKKINQDEVKGSVDFIWPLFVQLFKLDDGSVAVEFKSNGIKDTKLMFDSLLNSYWNKLQQSNKLSQSP